MKEYNIIIPAVGGQGAKTLEKILVKAGVDLLYNVHAFMLKGLGQRQGSIYSIVRYSNTYSSYDIGRGEADLVIGLEPLETLRYHKYISKKTNVALSLSRILPASVTKMETKYPDLEKIVSALEEISNKVYTLENAQEIANKINPNALNILMLGFSSRLLKPIIKEESLKRAIKDSIKANIESNLDIFGKGKEEFKKKYLKV